ncbi:uncharacterized protein [Argopecten irradians]|uniref:uncharacterized protein n=1 Tax=Argopecten irradians TaxID=31199 RepID=UPI00371C56F4
MEFDVDQQTSQPTGETETGTMSLQSTELPNAPSTTVNVAVPCTLQTDSAPCQQLTSTVTQDDTAKLEDSNVEMSEPTVLNQESSEKHNEVPSKPEEHDVEYFRNLMATETNTFNGYCSKWEDVSKSTPEIDEEVEGQIRTCIGQAQLLIAQHFKQLKGLVDNCEFRTGEKETTLTDLQGFWDMIYYQVEDVHTKFTGLEKLKDNNWVQDKPKVTKKIVKKKPVAKPTVKRPAVASKFAAFRAQMKKKQTAPDILCHEEQAVTFDGGFFKVASPKKTPKFHCEAGSPQRKVSVSSAEKEKVSETTEKEKVTEPKKKPLMEVLSPAVNSLGLTSLRTPSRKSYVPVNPSPLLLDITPQVASKGRPAPHSKRMCTGVETETSLNNEENDVDDFFANDNAVKPIPAVKCVTGTPRSKVSPRRSLQTRRSLCDMSSPSTAKESKSDNDFLKYLQPNSTTVTQATNNVSALDDECDAWDPSTAFSASDYVKKDSPAVSRRRSSSLKQLPSTQRRRSTRRSVHFSTSPTTEHTPELENITDVAGAVSEDMLLFTPPGHKSSIQLHDYVSNSMNAGATPACRNPRPSLLYTPPENASPLSSTTTHTDIPTDILVSFTP